MNCVQEVNAASAASSSSSKPPRRQIDDFLDQLKSAVPEVKAAEGGDPLSTNLYVGNLSPQTSEDDLREHFQAFGEVHSVKIMWPRSEDEAMRGKLCGFVCYRQRAAADKALLALQDVPLKGHRMTIGWGKAVKMENWKGATPDGAHYVRIEVQLPADGRIRDLIDRTARSVASDGEVFERTLMDLERGNTDFAFLHCADTLEGVYYRWRTYAYVMGDGDKSWHAQPYRLTTAGAHVLPPLPCISGSSISRNVSIPAAPPKVSRAFSNLLSELSLSRASILACTVYIYDALGAGNGSGTLSMAMVEAIAQLLISTPHEAVKVAALYLCSDLLYNSAVQVKGATAVKNHLQARLPGIFCALAAALRAATGRMSRQQILDRIVAVLRAWADWSMFPAPFLLGLEAVLHYNSPTAEEVRAISVHVDEEALRRKAKYLGLGDTAELDADLDSGSGSLGLGNKERLAHRVQFVEQFIVNREGNGSAGAGDLKAHPGTASSDENDVDGEPLPPSMDEGIDGMPMPIAPTISAVDACDYDLDGEPLPLEDVGDLDGEPMDEEHYE